MLPVWDFIYDKLNAAETVMLLCVVESKGSSPGRRGFKMAIASDGTIAGTIGGGIMEYKFVEKAKRLLLQSEKNISIVQQFHDKEHAVNQSGMICSGSQMIAFVPLNVSDVNLIASIKDAIESHGNSIQISPTSIQLCSTVGNSFSYQNEYEWVYTESLSQLAIVHIIGGGHVSLALSECLHFLGFYVKVYDDRKDLKTLVDNSYANERIWMDYDRVHDYMFVGAEDLVIIMTVGYRTDKIVLKQLSQGSISYLGLLGSENKINTLFNELREEGVEEEFLKKIFAPIGLNIFSKTTQEIAISIAAEIIKEKNKQLPTGRNYE